MRRFIPLLAVALATAAVILPLRAEQLTPDEKTFIDKHISDVIGTETERLSDPSLTKVFATPFYKIKLGIKQADGQMDSSQSLIAVKLDDKLVDLSTPSSDADVPMMVKMFDPKFKLLADADAQTVQKCFDILYPPFMEEEKKIIKFSHKGNDWTFIRGKFFDTFSGYVITTNADGSVKTVKFSLKLTP